MEIKRNTDADVLSELHFEKAGQLRTTLADKDIELHSLMIILKDEICFEEYYGMADDCGLKGIPNSRYAKHRMYSITKSFVAVAVGLLQDEGRLSVKDRIVDFLPQLIEGGKISDVSLEEAKKLMKDEKGWISSTTIEDMLTMRTCHSKTTYKIDPNKDWVGSFFKIKPDKEPGVCFDYDTSASHALGALTEALTGMTIMDYLRMKLEPLSLSEEAYIVKDPFGVEVGGAGLICTVEDLYRFAMLIRNNGVIDGRRLISKEYLDRATAKQTETRPVPGLNCGYGYYFWQHDHDGYMCFGKDGQFIYFLPKTDMIFITTADTSKRKDGNQILLDELGKLASQQQTIPEI